MTSVRSVRSVFVFSALLLIPCAAVAGPKTWSGLGADNNWSTGGNWVGGTAPVASDDLFFPDGALHLTNNNDFPAGTAFTSITFSGTSGGYHLTGNALVTSTISGSNTSTVHLVDFGITLSGTLTVSNVAGGAISLEGPLTGSGALVKNGAGELDMSGTNTYTGTTTINGGLVSVGVSASVLGAGDGTSGTGTAINTGAELRVSSSGLNIANERLTIDGGVFGANVPNVTFGGPVVVNAGGAELKVFSGDNVTVAGNVSGPGTLDKTLTGVATLSGTNSVGATFVHGGTLFVTGSEPLTGMTAFSGGTFGGTGTVGNVGIFAGGTLAPGLSPGIINIGAISFLAGGTFSVELNGATAGAGYDQLKTTGAISLNGTTLSATLGFAPAPGTALTIIDNGSGVPIGSTFAGLPNLSNVVIGGQLFVIRYDGGDGNDVVLTAIAGVPSMPLPMIILLGLSIASIAALMLARRLGA